MQFDQEGVNMMARVTIDAGKPLRRWILIDSVRIQSTNLYDIQYEKILTFASHVAISELANMFFPTLETHDTNWNQSFDLQVLCNTFYHRPMFLYTE